MELELRKARNQLEEDKKTFELKLQRSLDQERTIIQQDTAKKIEQEHRLRNAERDKRLQDALKANEELRRKLEQGSQQTQGEVLELKIEETLKNAFPLDQISPVPKGFTGADVLQQVNDATGRNCGTIVWESKRTKTWSDEWSTKLKEDQRRMKAEIAVIVSEILPKDIINFGPKNGVYVTNFVSFLGLANILRKTLIQIAFAKQTSRRIFKDPW